jgi:taurine dioxygenase
MNRAFVERSVLVIRDQTLTPPQVAEAVGLFGSIFPQQNTKFAIPDCPQIHYVSNRSLSDGRRYIPGDGWHTDH